MLLIGYFEGNDPVGIRLRGGCIIPGMDSRKAV
jgi:hypothetical protein